MCFPEPAGRDRNANNFYKFCWFLGFFFMPVLRRHWVIISCGDFTEFDWIFSYILNAIPRPYLQSSFDSLSRLVQVLFMSTICVFFLPGALICKVSQMYPCGHLAAGSWSLLWPAIFNVFINCKAEKNSDYKRQIIFILLPSEGKVGTIAEQLFGLLSGI